MDQQEQARLIVLEAAVTILLMPMVQKLQDAKRLNADMRGLLEPYGDQEIWWKIQQEIDNLVQAARDARRGPDGVLLPPRE